LEKKKQKNQQIKNLIDILSNFFNASDFKPTEKLVTILLNSCLLPLLENAFRSGSLLEMSQEADLYFSYFSNSLLFSFLIRSHKIIKFTTRSDSSSH
jgi:hypothetical protein